ncbi:MAG: TIGR01459 family HAD-type hydrolase [Planctomycetota bacterium]|nr:TIGR01459 family HAD-type hydrolase [Planctomycetota bacterium]
MSAVEALASLDSLHGRYDAVFCDLWGVVHNGKRPFEPACAALARFRERGGVVVLVTNVPKQRDPIPRQLERIGVRRDAWDVIVTSGDAIRGELGRRAPGPMHLIGPPNDTLLWDGLGLELADVEHARFLCVTGLDDFESDVPDDYRERLVRAHAHGLEMVCANPDIVVRLGEKLYWCAGALARDYESLGGHVVMAGKPHAPIYELALAELATRLGRTPDRSRVLAIGDGPGTDIVGANRQGFDALFVASGIHEGELHGHAGLDLAEVAATLAKAGATARYAMAELA